MKPLYYVIIISFCTLQLLSCKKNDDHPTAPITTSTHINFGNLEVGQQSRYIIFSSGWYQNAIDTLFPYSNDTLVVEVFAKDTNGFIFREHFAYQDSIHRWIQNSRDKVYYYYANTSNDSLKLSPLDGGNYVPSILFNFYICRYGLDLSEYTNTKTQIKNWRVNLPYDSSDKRAYVTDVTILGNNYAHLNVLMMNEGMATDSPGHTILYNKETGIVRFSNYSSWVFDSYGGDLLP